MTRAMKREVWTWYLPSHLVPAKILCSRCEPCTNINATDDNRLKCVCVSNVTFPQSAYCHPCYDHYSFHHYSQLIKRFIKKNSIVSVYQLNLYKDLVTTRIASLGHCFRTT